MSLSMRQSFEAEKIKKTDERARLNKRLKRNHVEGFKRFLTLYSVKVGINYQRLWPGVYYLYMYVIVVLKRKTNKNVESTWTTARCWSTHFHSQRGILFNIFPISIYVFDPFSGRRFLFSALHNTRPIITKKKPFFLHYFRLLASIVLSAFFSSLFFHFPYFLRQQFYPPFRLYVGNTSVNVLRMYATFSRNSARIMHNACSMITAIFVCQEITKWWKKEHACIRKNLFICKYYAASVL